MCTDPGRSSKSFKDKKSVNGDFILRQRCRIDFGRERQIAWLQIMLYSNASDAITVGRNAQRVPSFVEAVVKEGVDCTGPYRPLVVESHGHEALLGVVLATIETNTGCGLRASCAYCEDGGDQSITFRPRQYYCTVLAMKVFGDVYGRKKPMFALKFERLHSAHRVLKWLNGRF